MSKVTAKFETVQLEPEITADLVDHPLQLELDDFFVLYDTVIEFFTTLFIVSGEYLPDIFKIDSDSKLLMRSIVAEIVGFCHGYITIDLVTALDRESSSTADTVRLLVPDSDGGFSVVETSEELE